MGYFKHGMLVTYTVCKIATMFLRDLHHYYPTHPIFLTHSPHLWMQLDGIRRTDTLNIKAGKSENVLSAIEYRSI